jgi:hypothetical protein
MKFSREDYILYGIYFSFSALILHSCFINYSADTISYFQIARLYSTGEFYQAINAYWSPLLSWLMAPLLVAGFDSFTAFKFVNIIAGFGLLYWSSGILKGLTSGYKTRWAALICILVLALEAQVSSFTPDFLSACLLTGFLNSKFLNSPLHARVLLGGALVFAKSVFLPVVLILLAIRFFMSEKEDRKTLITTAAGIIAIAFVWSASLSLKYDRIMLNSSTAYNLDLSLKRNGIHYNSTAGLIKPEQNGMLFSWQDPTYYPTPPVQFNYPEIKTRLEENVFRLAYFFSYTSAWPNVLLIPLCAFLIIPVHDKKTMLFLSLCITLCLAAYLLFIPENRYFIAPQFIFIILCFYSAEKLFAPFPVVFTGVLIILSFSILKQAWVSIKNYSGQQAYLSTKYRDAQNISALVQDKKIARMASNSHGEGANTMSYVAFLSGVKYYGELGYFMPAKDQYDDLKKMNIDLLCLFGDENIILKNDFLKNTDTIKINSDVTAFVLNKK